MLPPDLSRRALLRLFRTKRVATLPMLFRALRTRSRMSVFRRLSLLPYLSSYSHAGGYYTLEQIPELDEHGLWRHQGVCFSRHGTLKQTLEHLVHAAPTGRAHPELEALVHVRAHNTLLDLVREKRLGRVRLAGHYLYISRDPRRAKAQIARRRSELSPEAPKHPMAPPGSVVLEILLEIARSAKVVADPKVISAGLAARGLPVSSEQVEGVLEAHGLKKTARSPSRRSRR